MGVTQLLNNIEKGKEGRNIGISTGLSTLDSIIYGIQRKYLYVVGADTSGGKTSFAVDVFVYNLIKNAGPRPISILYYSFENFPQYSIHYRRHLLSGHKHRNINLKFSII